MATKKTKNQPYYGGGDRNRRDRNKYGTPITTIKKSLTYSADTPDLILDVDATASATASKAGTISAVKIKNDGYVPAIASFVYNSYTAADTIDSDATGLRYVKYLLNPNEEIMMPTTRAIIGDAVGEFTGTAVDSAAITTAESLDTGADVDTATSSDITSDATITTINLEDGHSKYFYAGDLIRIDNEILEVLSVGTGADLANSTLTVKRGVMGSTAATHNDDRAVHLPFFNMHHKYVAAGNEKGKTTDSNGRWKSMNFFGLGRSQGNQAGLTAGSIAIQFYEAGFAKANLSDITANTESGLPVSTAHEFDITVDGGTTFDNLTFTTDSSNTKFGGSTGIIAKIQDALDTQYYTAGNLFEKKVTVGLEDGDIVFRSGSFLSTSAIAIGAGSTGAAEFLGTGRIPSAFESVDARLQTETEYNPITNDAIYKEIFIRDDGNGNLIWKNEQMIGEVNYETGAISWALPERPNAEFVISVLHTNPFSGKLDATQNSRRNSLRQILGNTPQQKCEAQLTVTTY
tara:strand:+ start:1959 stop:3512 length:1554 start_codon:yes stop_codon:yes gene_type:complete